MKIFYSATHAQHNPAFEVYDGGKRMPYLESPQRMERILNALQKTDWADIHAPRDFGLGPIRATHSEAYLNFLASAWTMWRAADPEAASSAVVIVLPCAPILRSVGSGVSSHHERKFLISALLHWGHWAV